MRDLKGTRTEQNLKEAFAGESKAHTKYGYYASVAKKEGWYGFAALFEETSKNEREHAEVWFKYLNNGSIPTTEENLKDAASGEYYENHTMYPEMAQIAREEGFDEIAAKMELVAEVEARHEARYRKMLDDLQTNEIKMQKSGLAVWKCDVCGHVHIGIKAPLVCPICGHESSFVTELVSYGWEPRKK